MTNTAANRNNSVSSPSRQHTQWLKEDVDFLRENYDTLGAKAVGERLGRSEGAVHHHAHRLNITKNRLWSHEEDDVLIENYATLGAKHVAEKLGRNEKDVQRRASMLNVKSTRRRVWSKEDEGVLR